MKKLVLVGLIALYGASMLAPKKPVRIDSVMGAVPNEYAIVQTTITRDPGKTDAKPIVQRSEIGRLRPGLIRPVPVGFKLTVPQLEVDLNVSAVTGSIADIAGAINPKAGVAAQAAHTIIDEGLKIASNELNKHYDIDPTTITLLEILPGKYYRVNVGTGEIDVTPAFKADLKKYRVLIKRYTPLARKFNEALRTYNKKYRGAAGPLGIPEAKRQQLLDLYDRTVAPVLRDKLKIEASLQQYPLHRATLMAVMTKEGEGCEVEGRAGPWKLYLYYYVGAKQTNVFEIPFCVTDINKLQDVVVTVLPNRVVKGIFHPGGLRFGADDPKSPSVTFPVMGQLKVDFASLESRPYSWFDEMIISEKADTIESYLFPFDIYTVLATREAEAKKKGDARTKANVEKLVASIEKLKAAKSQKDLEESATEAPAEPEEAAAPKKDNGEEEKPAADEEKSKEKSLLEKGKELLETGKGLLEKTGIGQKK